MISIVCPAGSNFCIALNTPVLQEAFLKDPLIATICMAMEKSASVIIYIINNVNAACINSCVKRPHWIHSINHRIFLQKKGFRFLHRSQNNLFCTRSQAKQFDFCLLRYYAVYMQTIILITVLNEAL